MRHLFPLLLALLFLAACSHESWPPDEFVGTFEVSDKSKALLPYADVSGLVFRNANAETITLTSTGIVDSFVRLCIYKPCAIALVDETCQFVAQERRHILFANDSITLELHVLWERPNNDETALDTSFVESIATITVDTSGRLQRTRFLSTTRDSNVDPSFIQARLADRINQVTLIDSTFNVVYTKDNQVWYAKDRGLVGFRWNNTLYELQEVIR